MLLLFSLDLDKAHLRYSYKQHTLVSLTVGETNDANEWHLPTYDPKNENKYHYKLHSLDIYFWTQSDALQFVNGIRRVLPAAQVEILDEPAPSEASSVVQQLEKVALDGSARGNAGKQVEQAPANFAPMAYNPAAPAAPETLTHREKTPPPDDGAVNPLAMAMAYDNHQQPFSPGLPPPPPGGPGLPGPPGLPGARGGPHPGLQRSATMPLHGGLGSPGLSSPYGNAFPGSPGFAPPPPPPPAGHRPYNPASGASQATPGRQDYSVHQQVYKPGEGEQASKYTSKSRLEEQTGRLERGVGGMLKKIEKRFG